ncbi:uncharacterized protein N7479_006670 [Penicillium vulpinum]|uniref:Uncharacterized protein n=1 Tax=Penicillium vulpinum TaxID=29845 RepID=A0A1V6RYW2_9EURO|nr:uncharacterized protein N7479_006670 [Penicillium vulpinum]KAJ5959520.1 hypothetical protein N7479_006670 [Penicillium vulpinum]OQE06798.1 hypothetical protein PENVUL_c016G04046 [Penicillium vulpinum]
MAFKSSPQPLVQGGHAHQPDELPSMFISSTVPAVDENTIILGATHPTLSTGNPIHDGWFISDFYAFNFLLKGLGMEQTWLTAAEPEKLVQKYGSYLHGNPYEERKICLSQELLDSDELSPVTVVSSAKMIDRFLMEAKRASELAKRTSAPLLLLVFCHGLPSFDLLLDNGNRHKGLSAMRLKGVLEPGVRVTLITTACHSGGWVTNPDFNYTTMAAANAARTSKGLSNSWGISQSIGRTCGSVFASTLVESLSSATSPLIDPSERSTPSNFPGTQSQLQPDEPDEHQTMTYNAFCHSIWRTCEHRVTRLWYAQGFSFSAQDDQWNFSWTGRTGIPLRDFERRWKTLASYPYTGPADVRDLRNTYLENLTFLEADSANTGGAEGIVDQMTESIAHGRIKAMGRLFHQTCPGDWDRGQMVGFGGTLRGYYERDEFKERASEFAATIRFRWEMGLLTDYVVSVFGLPMPSKKICILWDEFAWEAAIKRIDPTWEAREDKIRRALGDCLELAPRDDQGPFFSRPNCYLTAALVEANKPYDETMAIISAIGQFMETLKEFHQQRACEDEGVRRRGREWFKTVGRRALRSLSPRKRLPAKPRGSEVIG